MSKAASAIPVSTAPNAYRLLKDVIQAIREEPSRLFMMAWATYVDGELVWSSPSLEPEYTREEPEYTRDYTQARELPVPACGTVLCISGWITQMAYHAIPRLRSYIPDLAYYAVLGPDWELHSSTCQMKWQLHGIFYSTRFSTERVLEKLESFMREHKQFLLNRKLDPAELREKYPLFM